MPWNLPVLICQKDPLPQTYPPKTPGKFGGFASPQTRPTFFGEDFPTKIGGLWLEYLEGLRISKLIVIFVQKWPDGIHGTGIPKWHENKWSFGEVMVTWAMNEDVLSLKPNMFAPEKMLVGRLVSFWECLLSGGYVSLQECMFYWNLWLSIAVVACHRANLFFVGDIISRAILIWLLSQVSPSNFDYPKRNQTCCR